MQVHLVDHGFLKTEKTGARGCNGIAIKSHTCTAKPKDGEEGEPSRHICAHKQTSKPRSQNKVGKKVSTGVRASVLVMHLGEKDREHKPHVGDGKSTRQRTVELGLLQPSLHKVLCVLGKLKVLLCETHEETNQKTKRCQPMVSTNRAPASQRQGRENQQAHKRTHTYAHTRTHMHVQLAVERSTPCNRCAKTSENSSCSSASRARTAFSTMASTCLRENFATEGSCFEFED